jgi:hypothetical protein
VKSWKKKKGKKLKEPSTNQPLSEITLKKISEIIKLKNSLKLHTNKNKYISS